MSLRTSEIFAVSKEVNAKRASETIATPSPLSSVAVNAVRHRASTASGLQIRLHPLNANVTTTNVLFMSSTTQSPEDA